MSHSFNYDETDVAKSYDSSRRLDQATITQWLDAIAKRTGTTSIHNVLDWGCGTGRFLEPLARYFDAHVTGIDPSETMVEQAVSRFAQHHAIEVHLGDIESAPLRDSGFDLIFASMVYHHLPSPAEGLMRAFERTSPEGYIAIRNATKEDIESLEWFTFFPEAQKIELGRMPSRADLQQAVAAAGFRESSCFGLRQSFASTYKEHFDKISLRGVSVLNLITDEQFETGKERYRSFCADRWESTPPLEEFTLVLARRPEGQPCD